MSENGILEAIAAGDLERVQSAIGDDPVAAAARREDGLSAVTLAAYHGQGAILEALLAAGPPLDVFEAAIAGRDERVSELLSERPELARAEGPDGYTALHLAAFFDHPSIVDMLLESGANPNHVAPGQGNRTPLHSAAAAPSRDAVASLLAAGADPDASQEGSFRPIHEAAQNGDEALVDLLLANGADPSLTTGDGRDAAALARDAGHEDLARRLEGALAR